MQEGKKMKRYWRRRERRSQTPDLALGKSIHGGACGVSLRDRPAADKPGLPVIHQSPSLVFQPQQPCHCFFHSQGSGGGASILPVLVAKWGRVCCCGVPAWFSGWIECPVPSFSLIG